MSHGAAPHCGMEVVVDPKELLFSAWRRLYRLPSGFPGFRARVTAHMNGIRYEGLCEVDGFVPRSQLPETVRKKVDGELYSLLKHRKPSDFWQADGRHPMEIVGEGPEGFCVQVNDGGPSRLWVKDDRYTLVERNPGKISFRLHFRGYQTLPGGLLVPSHVVLVERGGTGNIQKVKLMQDSYQAVGPYWLPKERFSLTEASDGLEGIWFSLEEVVLRD